MRRRSRPAATAVLLLAGGLVLAPLGCGGRSVAHVTTSGDDDDTDGNGKADAGKPSSTGSESCVAACHQCFEASLDEPCDVTCGKVFEAAKKSKCDAVLTSLLFCREQKQTCDSRACADDNNDLAVCILNYCDEDPNDPLCTAPV